MRTILPYPQSSTKDALKFPVPQSAQQEATNHECSSPLNTMPAGVNSDHSKCAILQGSEKENIQPVSEETHCENTNDCGTGNSGTDTNEDIKVHCRNCYQWEGGGHVPLGLDQ